MTRFTKTASGKYVVSGHSYEMLIGSRAQVWHGTAYKTTGGLTKAHLLKNKCGHIVSRSKHTTAKKEKRLVKAGYGTKKGKFGFVKLHGKSRKMRGGVGARAVAAHNMSSNSSSVAPLARAAALTGGSRRRYGKKGGMVNLPLSPSYYDGKGVGTSGVELQFIAGQGN
jgi:hypothetical protein